MSRAGHPFLALLATWLPHAAGMTYGGWTVKMDEKGTISSVGAEGMDLRHLGRGECPSFKTALPELKGMNAPVLVDGKTGEVHACALADRCAAPQATDTTQSFCYHLVGVLGKNSHIHVRYNVTVTGATGTGGGFSILQDIAIESEGEDKDSIMVLQLPFPVQPNKMVTGYSNAETRLSDGRPHVTQVAGGFSGPAWSGQFPMSENPMAQIIDRPATADQLALPMVVQVAPSVRLQVAHTADPYYSTAFKFAGDGTGDGCWQSVFSIARNPSPLMISRRFATVVHASTGWDDHVEAFYGSVLPHVPVPPQWTRDVALSHFDYFTSNGTSWNKEVDWLAARLSKAERSRVVFAQQGWYDNIGDYSYDPKRDAFLDNWTFGPNSPFWVPGTGGSKGHWDCRACNNCCDGQGQPKVWEFPLSVKAVRESYQYARSRGFRVLHYFGDGLAMCKTARTYNASHVFPDGLVRGVVNHMADCKCGPGDPACNAVQNPLIPEVYNFYIKFMKALLREFGDVIDGFVWDETFYIRPTDQFVQAAGGYAATANLRLIEELTAMVHAHNPEMVFMSSDMPWPDFVPYGIVASGQFPDFEVAGMTWPALYATTGRRAAVWSCDWEPVAHLGLTVATTCTYGSVPSLGMTFHTGQYPNVGISGMATKDSDTILRLFRGLMAGNACNASSDAPKQVHVI